MSSLFGFFAAIHALVTGVPYVSSTVRKAQASKALAQAFRSMDLR